jgi:hypothetical protein
MECVNLTSDDAARVLRYTVFNPSNLPMRSMTVIVEGAPDLAYWKRTPVPELVIGETSVGMALAGLDGWWNSWFVYRSRPVIDH